MDRQEVLNLVADRLKTIKIANGYETDLGKNVFKWRLTPVTQKKFPAVNLTDTEEEYIYDPDSEGKYAVLQIEFNAIAKDFTEMYAVLRDVEKAIGQDEHFGGKLLEAVVDSVKINAEQNEQIIVAAEGVLQIKYYAERFRGV